MKAWWLALVFLIATTSAGAVEELSTPPAAEPVREAAAPSEAPADAAAAPVSSSPAVPEPIISPPPAQPATPDDAVRAALNGTSWEVQVTPLGGAGKPSKDTLSFADGQVSSASLTKAGYPSTNYSLTLREDGTASWETMQGLEGKGIVFWRGELGGPSMRGIMSKRPAEGPTEDYAFSGPEATGKVIDISAAALEGAAAQMPAITPSASPAPAAGAPSAPAPKKNKKGRF